MKRRYLLMVTVVTTAFGLSVAACDESKEVEPEDAAEAPVDDKPAEPETKFGLKWGAFDDHPARAAVEDCRELKALDVMMFRELLDTEEEIDAARYAGYLDIDYDPEANEFKRKKAERAIAERVLERKKQLERSSACLSTRVHLSDYDFDAQGFGLRGTTDSPLFATYPNLSPDGDSAIRRLSMKTETKPPPGFEMPAILALADLPERFPVDEARAEKLGKSLPEFVPEDWEEPEDDDSHTGRGTLEPSARAPGLDRLPEGMLSALLLAERYEGGGDTAEDDGKKPIGEVFRDIQKLTLPDQPARSAQLIAVVEPVGGRTEQMDMEGLEIPAFFAGARVVTAVLADQNGRVFATTPAPSERFAENLGQLLEPSAEADREPLDDACGGHLYTAVDTQLVDGALVDVEIPKCRRCPPGASSKWGRTPLEHVSYGHFSRPGYQEALVFTEGCESNANGGGGATLLRRYADGHWRRVNYSAGGYQDCLTVADPDGQHHLVCTQAQASGGTYAGDIYTATPAANGTEFDRKRLLPIYSNKGRCDDEYTDIQPVEHDKADRNNDGVLDLVYKLRVRSGVWENCDEDEMEDGSVHELVFLAVEGGLEPTGETKKKLARIEKLQGGE